MKYSKPVITNVVDASAAIQSSTDKSAPMFVDANPILGYTATSPAYEADE